ncbi:MAG: hypothetical protein GVY13_04235 [Alphaproteobacteria bacterium]|jgi:carbamoyltransferase|nr:hypothetical protein [Alphaproteobacteria bacterium]
MPANNYLGLHVGHDRAISVVSDGRLIFHIAAERIDRVKYSFSPELPISQIKVVLASLDIKASDLRAVAVSYHGICAKQIARTFEREFLMHFSDFNGAFFAVNHHLAHALGSFVASGQDESLSFVADGAGDTRHWGTQAETLFHVNRTNFYLVQERLQHQGYNSHNRPEFYDVSFFRPEDDYRQISLGLKYEQMTYLCGFKPGQAGQTMALASYGNPLIDVERYVPKDFRFSLTYTNILAELAEMAQKQDLTLREFAALNRADIAATVQEYLQYSLVSLTNYIIEHYKPKNLSFSGGVFL